MMRKTLSTSSVVQNINRRFYAVQILVVSLIDDGRIEVVSKEKEGDKVKNEPVNEEKRKLKSQNVPFGLTCILLKKYILDDLTAAEESIIETIIPIVLDSSYQLLSLYKLSGPVLAFEFVVQHSR
ncbi:uncharacterized protein [Rutidosis leptorrhynchoides]|uniref:uncharacterized protein n=1 Tax=Rutidosis leptorrhynchoides TaxID=125765 RepID=UPI003A9A5D36